MCLTTETERVRDLEPVKVSIDAVEPLVVQEALEDDASNAFGTKGCKIGSPRDEGL
jgi:hypothetical protein